MKMLVIFGTFGSFALIISMLLMALHIGRTTSLVTTSEVMALSIVLEVGRGCRSSSENVFLGTAAYAAVLIVFVEAI